MAVAVTSVSVIDISSRRLSSYRIYIYIYIYIYICVCVCVCVSFYLVFYVIICYIEIIYTMLNPPILY